MNLDMGLEISLSTPYLVVPSPQAPSLVVTLIPGRGVLAAADLVPVRAVTVLAPVDVIGCWSQTWAMTSQKSLRSIQCQRLHPCQPRPLRFYLSNSNNGGSVLKRRRRGCMRVPWLVSNRCKVYSRYLPLNQAHRFRYVGSVIHDRTTDFGSARRTCRCGSNPEGPQRSAATLEHRGAREAAIVRPSPSCCEENTSACLLPAPGNYYTTYVGWGRPIL